MLSGHDVRPWHPVPTSGCLRTPTMPPCYAHGQRDPQRARLGDLHPMPPPGSGSRRRCTAPCGGVWPPERMAAILLEPVSLALRCPSHAAALLRNALENKPSGNARPMRRRAIHLQPDDVHSRRPRPSAHASSDQGGQDPGVTYSQCGNRDVTRAGMHPGWDRPRRLLTHAADRIGSPESGPAECCFLILPPGCSYAPPEDRRASNGDMLRSRWCRARSPGRVGGRHGGCRYRRHRRSAVWRPPVPRGGRYVTTMQANGSPPSHHQFPSIARPAAMMRQSSLPSAPLLSSPPSPPPPLLSSPLLVSSPRLLSFSPLLLSPLRSLSPGPLARVSLSPSSHGESWRRRRRY